MRDPEPGRCSGRCAAGHGRLDQGVQNVHQSNSDHFSANSLVARCSEAVTRAAAGPMENPCRSRCLEPPPWRQRLLAAPFNAMTAFRAERSGTSRNWRAKPGPARIQAVALAQPPKTLGQIAPWTPPPGNPRVTRSVSEWPKMAGFPGHPLAGMVAGCGRVHQDRRAHTRVGRPPPPWLPRPRQPNRLAQAQCPRLEAGPYRLTRVS